MDPSHFVNLGVGSGALFVLYHLVAPVTRAHIRTLDRLGDTMVAATRAMDSIQETQVSVTQTLDDLRRDASTRHQEILDRLDRQS